MATSTQTIPSKTGKDQLQDAVTTFANSLSTTDRQSLPANPDVKDIINFVSDANKLHSKRKSRVYGERIQPFLKALHQFAGTVDVMVQSNPEITSLVWGSPQTANQVAMAHNNYFEDVSKILQRVGKLCPLIEEFNALLPDPDLQDAVCEFYSIIIKLFTTLVPVLQKGGWKSFFKAVVGSLKGDVQELEAQLERHRGYVEGYIQLASERVHHRERQLNVHFRSHVIDHTAREVSRWNTSSDWRIQQDQRYISCAITVPQHQDDLARLTLFRYFLLEMRRNLLLEKITGHNYHDMYFRHLSKVQEGTGGWVFDFNEFRSWETESSAKPLFWCHGIPGSGKSVLTATITKYFLEKHPKSTAFFFCDFQQKSSLQWEAIVRSLIRQLLSTTDQHSTILEVFEKPMSQNQVIATLQELLKLNGRCYLIFDGIDECEEADKYKLLWLFDQLFCSNEGKTKILVSCRYSVDISRKMAEGRVCEINLHQHVGPDVERYIAAELQERIQFRRLTVTPEMRKEIETALAANADGMFLYVRFQLDDICTAITEDALRDCLQGLPRGLPETYDRILVKIENDQDFRMAKKVFNWIVAASAPLTVEELAEACAFEPGDKQYTDGRFATDDWKLVFNCNNLITIERRDGRDFVHFAHSTILDHLRKKDVVIDSVANQDAASICLTYLNLTDFERQLIPHQPNQPVYVPPPKDWVPSLISPSQQVSTTAKVAHTASKIKNLGTSKASTLTLPPIDLTAFQNKFSKPDSALKGLDRKYKFVEYARQNWIEHCRFISSDSPCRDSFAKLVNGKNLPFKHLPWADDIPDNQDSIEYKDFTISISEWVPVEWAVRCQHLPLLQLLRHLTNNPVKWDIILSLHITPEEKTNFLRNGYRKNWCLLPRMGDWKPYLTEKKYLELDNIDRHWIFGFMEDTLFGQGIKQDLDIAELLLFSCPSFGIPLSLFFRSTAVLSFFCREDSDISPKEVVFRYGPYFVTALGAMIAVVSDFRLQGLEEASQIMIELIRIILKSGRIQPDEPAYHNMPKAAPFTAYAKGIPQTTPPKRPIPTYLKWALDLGLPDVVDMLASFDATTRAPMVGRAAPIGASGTGTRYFDDS
ncbi:hypothetical protein TWF281_009039 [Arthrobotrys megalospora]